MASPPPEDESLISTNEGSGGNLLERALHWSEGGGSGRKRYIVGGFVVFTFATIGMWLAMADWAANPEPVEIAQVLQALDDGDNELAHALVQQMQDDAVLQAVDYGGPLFVLGALKVRDADKEWSAERKRNDFLIASKYLSEAQTIGWPEGREAQGLYLLGKSQIESRQLKAGVETLHKALRLEEGPGTLSHLLLAEAYYFAPAPRYEKAIEHLDKAIADTSLAPRERSGAHLRRAEALTRLGRTDEAQESLEQAGELAGAARGKLVEGKVLVKQIEGLLAGKTIKKEKYAPAEAIALGDRALAALEKARRLDKLATPVSRQSEYLKARTHDLLGRIDDALREYGALRRNLSSSPAGVAAGFAEADLHRRMGDNDQALAAYRRVLDAMDSPENYRGSLLPLAEARRRIHTAHEGFVEQEAYSAADQLIDWIDPLLPRVDQLLMRAKTLRMWGLMKIEQAETDDDNQRELRREGRLRLREAGVAYEQLAESRFSTKRFTDDLWTAAESYFLGQSYTSSARVLERYLRHETQQRNAIALLRLGESYLARGGDSQAIATLEECLEFHPNDASSYRARLECAKAYEMKEQPDKAESLLRDNLFGSALTPASPEWRDSKFALGRLLAYHGKHPEAIRELEEAIAWYPEDSQSRLARYLIAEAYRHSAADPLERLKAAKTVNERERNREEAQNYLQEALDRYKEVQQEITLSNSSDKLDRVMLRNCYMLAGEVQFELGAYEDAIKLYSEVSTLYQNEPFVLETLVQVSHCWRRLKDNVKARGAIQAAKLLLTRLPPDADFATSTNLNRTEWEQLLDQLAQF